MTARAAQAIKTMRPACSSQVKTVLSSVPQKFHQTEIPLRGLLKMKCFLAERCKII